MTEFIVLELRLRGFAATAEPPPLRAQLSTAPMRGTAGGRVAPPPPITHLGVRARAAVAREVER